MNLKNRFFGAGVHLSICLVIAVLAWFVIFKFFYPYPFIEISGGRQLFLLIVAVDVVLGPLLTFAVLSPGKVRQLLRLDLMMIGAVQMAALVYGLGTMYFARPVYLVHEVDRFKVVSAADVTESDLAEAALEFRRLPIIGVETIGLRPARNSAEKLSSLDLEIAGRDLSLQPGWWQPLSGDNRASIRQHGKSVALLRQRVTDGGAEINRILSASGLRDEDAIALPLVANLVSWSVLLDKRDLKILGYLPIDLF
jgi:hypothetical protein